MKKLKFRTSSDIFLIIKSTKIPILLLISALIFKGLLFIPQIKLKLSDLLNVIDNVVNLFIILSLVLMGYFICLAFCNIYKSYLVRKKIKTANSIIAILKNGMTLVFALIAINQFISAFKLKSDYLNFAHNIILVIIIAAVSWVLLEILSIIETIVYNKFSKSSVQAETRKTIALYTKIHILRYIAQTVIIFLAIAASLMVFDKVRNIGISLLASAGFLTAIFALAAQKSLGSLFTGVQMVLAQPLEIGDLVVVENESGVVEEITLTYVIIRVWDSRRLIFPIGYFFDKPFQNWSRSSEGVSGTIKIYVDYAVSIDAIRKELHEFIKEHSLWDQQKFKVSISDFKENTVELKIVLSATHPSNLDLLREEVREKLLSYICKNHRDSLPKLRFIPPQE